MSDHMAFYVLAVMNAGGVLGRIAPAYLSDRLGRFNLLVPSAFLSGLSCIVFWFFAKSLVSVMLFSVVYGFLSGSFASVVNSCVAQISDMSQMGTRTGMLYSIISFPWVPLFSVLRPPLFFFSFLFSMVAVMFSKTMCQNKRFIITLLTIFIPDLSLVDPQQALYSPVIMDLTISWFFSVVQLWYLDLSSF